VTCFINSVLEFGQGAQGFFVLCSEKIILVHGGLMLYFEIKEFLSDILQFVFHELGLGRTLRRILVVDSFERSLNFSINGFAVVDRAFSFSSVGIFGIRSWELVISFFGDNIFVAALTGIALLTRMLVNWTLTIHDDRFGLSVLAVLLDVVKLVKEIVELAQASRTRAISLRSSITIAEFFSSPEVWPSSLTSRSWR